MMTLNREKLDLWLSRGYKVEVNEIGIECEVESQDIHCLGCDTLLYNFLVNGHLIGLNATACENCGIRNYILGTEIKMSMNTIPRFCFRIKVILEIPGKRNAIPLLAVNDTGKIIKPFSMKDWLEQ